MRHFAWLTADSVVQHRAIVNAVRRRCNRECRTPMRAPGFQPRQRSHRAPGCTAYNIDIKHDAAPLAPAAAVRRGAAQMVPGHGAAKHQRCRLHCTARKLQHALFSYRAAMVRCAALRCALPLPSWYTTSEHLHHMQPQRKQAPQCRLLCHQQCHSGEHGGGDAMFCRRCTGEASVCTFDLCAGRSLHQLCLTTSAVAWLSCMHAG
jgi:hypothetical protein